MIKQDTIELVRNRASLEDVVGRTVKLKRAGAGLTGCCPFHDEKTPSFHVFVKGQNYKCFGCGKGGDVFGFVMETQRKTFTEAVEMLAAEYNIALEYDHITKEEAQEKKDKKKEMQEVLAWAAKRYNENLSSLPLDSAAMQYLAARGISRETSLEWELGVAPDDFKFLTTPLINMGRYEPGTDAGVVTTKEGRSYDFLVNRIVIPVHDVNGQLVTLAGRSLPGTAKEMAKYLNGRESLLYSKSKTLYGLYQALRAGAIKAAGFAYLVEGYFDVISLHEADVRNAVAPCGTAITEEQVMFLKRYTQHVVLMQDADKAGTKSMLKAIDLFLAADFKVDVLQLPTGMDADDYARKLMARQPAALEEAA